MRDAFGRGQRLLVLGGASDLGAAIAARLVGDGCREVVLAGRHPDAMAPVEARLRAAGATAVHVVRWDADDVGAHEAAVDEAFASLGGSDVDIVVLAAGILGSQEAFDADPATAAAAITTNFGGAASTLLFVANRLRAQGHGTIVVLSSVAGERVRAANFVYGATKAGLDAFAQGLGDALAGTGVDVLVVRPGWVRTQMTDGMDPAPFATTPEAVAAAVADGLAKGKDIVWAPGVLRYVFAGFRHLPRPVWRKVAATR